MIDVAIKDKKDCMGCHACSNICPKNCISMERDSEGFWYPEVDYSQCIKCKQCIKVCPIINKTTVDNNPSAYACINKNEEIRMESSSGGIFTLLAEQVIDNDGIVFGAGFMGDFSVAHIFVGTKADLGKLRGSKYVQSRIGDTYRQAKGFLDEGRQVLFSGTPCQIGGLKSYLKRPYDNLFCIDIICHGVPSPKVWDKYVAYREDGAGAPPQRIAFRQKNDGWKRYSVSFLYKNNTEYQKTLDKDLYMKAFLKDICLRPSCHDCEFKSLNRESDITLADFWGIQNVLPEMDDDKGTSLIFVNSTSGQAILEKIKGKILCEEVDINQAVAYNPAAIKSSKPHPKREEFFRELEQLEFDKLVKKYCTDKMSVRVMRKVKSVVYVGLKRAGLLGVVRKVIRR